MSITFRRGGHVAFVNRPTGHSVEAENARIRSPTLRATAGPYAGAPKMVSVELVIARPPKMVSEELVIDAADATPGASWQGSVNLRLWDPPFF